MTDNYLKTQIITYMGNKRKILKHIEIILLELKKKIISKRGGEVLIRRNGFSGSGIISRMLEKLRTII